MIKIKKSKNKIAVAMSGGVDSSVAARLLKKDYEPSGIFLHFWKEEIDGEDMENKCCSTKALNDARRVARKVGIPLYTFNFNDVFKSEIVDDFLYEYANGRTPNPCVRCNKRVKLGLLIKRAKDLGIDYVASGHYARIKKTRNPESKKAKFIYKLFRAKDKSKDQSYFLYTFSQDELSHLLFPLGGYKKDEVRKMAKKFKLDVAEKKDSQEICFISGKSHNDFLRRHLKFKPGLIKTFTGKTIGKHHGLPLYTIGQRKGVEIGGTGPFYVAKFDYKKNILYVVNDGNDKSLFKDRLVAKGVNWISGVAPKLPFKCEAVIRYGHKAVKCAVKKKNKTEYSVIFNKPERAITPGQSVVFYKGDEVIGGGIIAG